MLSLFKTLVTGASAQAEERLESKYSLELIRQKIREAQAALNDAKGVLVTLIQRQKTETRQLEDVQNRIDLLTSQAKEAMAKDRADLAQEAAVTIAGLENEAKLRQATISHLDTRILRLRGSVEQMNRRLIDLKQGEVTARAYRKEAQAQKSLNRSAAMTDSFIEAEDLIARVLQEDDPFEQAEIAKDLNSDLDGSSIATRMHDAGLGKSDKVTAADVLARLKTK